jgi:hypothetical protein
MARALLKWTMWLNWKSSIVAISTKQHCWRRIYHASEWTYVTHTNVDSFINTPFNCRQIQQYARCMGNVYRTCGTDVFTQICREYGAISTSITSKCQLDCNHTRTQSAIAPSKYHYLDAMNLVIPNTTRLTCKFSHCLVDYFGALGPPKNTIPPDAEMFFGIYEKYRRITVDGGEASCR